MGWYGIEFLVNVFEIFLYVDFIGTAQRKKISSLAKTIVMLLAGLGLLVINIIGESHILIGQYNFVIGFSILFFTNKMLMQQRLKKIVIGMIQFFFVLLLSDIITVLILNAFSDIGVQGILTQSSGRLVAMVLSKAMALYMIRLSKGLRSQDVHESKTSVVLMYTGLLFINTMLSLTLLYFFKWGAGHGYEELYVFLGLAGILGINFFIVFLTNYLITANKREQDNIRLQQQNFYYEKYIGDVEASREAFNKLHHNYKHDIQCISGLSQQKAYDDLSHYVDAIYKRLEETEFTNFACPVPLNALLHAKQDYAYKEAVDMELNVFMPRETAIDDYDLCNIIGNIIDNGIEACSKLLTAKKLLTVDIYIQKKMLFINSMNAIENNLQYENDKIATTKNDKSLHGYGISIIEEIASKYGGYSSISTESQTFNILVGIPFK